MYKDKITDIANDIFVQNEGYHIVVIILKIIWATCSFENWGISMVKLLILAGAFSVVKYLFILTIFLLELFAHKPMYLNFHACFPPHFMFSIL